MVWKFSRSLIAILLPSSFNALQLRTFPQFLLLQKVHLGLLTVRARGSRVPPCNAIVIDAFLLRGGLPVFLASGPPSGSEIVAVDTLDPVASRADCTTRSAATRSAAGAARFARSAAGAARFGRTMSCKLKIEL